MFLTQKYLTTTSIDGEPDVENRSEEVIRRNAYVLKQIENVLNDYPEYPYQVAFSIDELRSKLVAHVLRHSRNCCSVVGNAPKPKTDSKFSYRFTSERMRLDVLIRGSILHLLRENADWLSRKIQQLDSSVAAQWELSDSNTNYELN